MKILSYAISALVVTLLCVSSAMALSLDEAKQKGLVGETSSGYLGLVDSSSNDAKALITDINGKRKAEYQRIADKNSTDLGSVEKLAGKKAIEKTPTGQYVKTSNSDWIKK